MMKRLSLVVLAFVVALTFMFAGCAPARRPMDNTNQNATGNQTGYNAAGPYTGMYGGGTNRDNTNVGYRGANYPNYPTQGDNWGVRSWANDNQTGLNNGMYNNQGTNVGYNIGGNTGNTNTTQSEEIARAVEQIQGVDRATVVVTGNTAYCGISMDRNARNANERDIKRDVAQMVRTTGKDINTVYVSTEAGFMDRLRNVGNGLRNGRPVDAFTTELNEMVQRLTPNRW